MSLLRTIVLASALVSVVGADAVCAQELAPERATACQLQKDPGAYNHKLVQVTGFVSHGFEDSLVFDPQCGRWSEIWMEYGGTAGTGTMFCCPGSPDRSRPKPLKVEGLAIPLVANDRFREFDRLLHIPPDSIVHATLIGRFFAGKKETFKGSTLWGGYGHLGCCSLFVVEQVISVDPRQYDLDYSASSSDPVPVPEDCGYEDLAQHQSWAEIVLAQRRAETQEGDWAVSDPRRVAAEGLIRLTKNLNVAIEDLRETSATKGLAIYEWRSNGPGAWFSVVVNRPYVLSFQAKDPGKVAWVISNVYQVSCDDASAKPR